jgi:hypothetical protein
MKGMRRIHGVWKNLPYLDLFFAVLITLLFLIFNHILHSSGTSLGAPIRESLPERAVSDSWHSPAATALRSAFPSSTEPDRYPDNSSIVASSGSMIPALRPPPSRRITPLLNHAAAGVVSAKSPSTGGGHSAVLILGFNHNHRESRVKTMEALEVLMKSKGQRNIAFEFPSDLQNDFDVYCSSPQRGGDKVKFAKAMLARYPASALLNDRQREDCSRKLLGTESIKSLLDVAALARKYRAGVHLVDVPMRQVHLADPRIPYRNKVMAEHLVAGSGGKTVVALVGSAHIGHGDLGVSLDDRLEVLGAETLSVNVASPNAPSRIDWGTNRETADIMISEPGELAPVIAMRFPGM